MLTDFYNIWHRVYWDNKQHKSYWFAALSLEKWFTSFEHFGRCFLRYVGSSEMSWLLAQRWWLENEPLLHMTEVTIDSHAGSQALGEVYHHLTDVFLWQLFPDSLQSDLQGKIVLGFG